MSVECRSRAGQLLSPRGPRVLPQGVLSRVAQPQFVSSHEPFPRGLCD